MHKDPLWRQGLHGDGSACKRHAFYLSFELFAHLWDRDIEIRSELNEQLRIDFLAHNASARPSFSRAYYRYHFLICGWWTG